MNMEEYDKIIFLDIDGVLNTDRWEFHLISNELPMGDDFGIYFDQDSVNNLAKIIAATGAVIVIHSTWKLANSLNWVRLMWRKRRLPGHIFDITPNIPPCYNKMDEIDTWLKNHQHIRSYIILDDEAEFSQSQLTHLIRVDSSMGISKSNVKDSIAKLYISHFP